MTIITYLILYKYIFPYIHCLQPIDNEEIDESELLAAFEEENVTETTQQQEDVLDFPTVPTHNVNKTTTTTTTTTSTPSTVNRPAPAIPAGNGSAAGGSGSGSGSNRGNTQEEDEFKKLESMMAM